MKRRLLAVCIVMGSFFSTSVWGQEAARPDDGTIDFVPSPAPSTGTPGRGNGRFRTLPPTSRSTVTEGVSAPNAAAPVVSDPGVSAPGVSAPGVPATAGPATVSPFAGTCAGDCCGSGCCAPSGCNDCGSCCDGFCGPPGRVWLGAEYLLWWTKGQSYPPLVTTSPLGTPIGTAGLLGLPTTTILFGGDQGADLRSGCRFTAGLWFNDCQTIGVQARYYFLGTETDSFSASTATNPILMIPFFDPSGTQRRFVTSYPGFATGSININTSSRFYGGDISFLYNVCCGCNYRVDALFGWRTLRLNEDFGLRDTETDVETGQVIVSQDSFRTTNQFNGFDLGFQGEYRCDRWFVNGMARLGLGCNRQGVNIDGSSTINGTAFPGGLLALSSNSGSYNRNVFAVSPEINLNVGYQLCEHVRVMAGYSFIYLNNVVRPGQQIDTTINANLLPGNSGGGPARPSFQGRDTDFWAQGVNFGVQLLW